MNHEFGAVSYPAEHEVTQEERTWGMFAHLSSIIAGLFGLAPLGPLVVWLIKKDQSPFVAKHAIHALAFSIGLFIISVILIAAAVVLTCVFGLGIILAIIAGPLLFLAFLLYTILGAIRANEGKYFEYPVTSSFVK